jgi:peptidoglycan-N-acetylglucosamine deacetylase
VALCFGDGPDPIWTLLVSEALASVGARATFFVAAPRAARYPSLISSMRERGHDVAFHCVEHVRHDAMTRTPGARADCAVLENAVGPHHTGDRRGGKHRLRLVSWTADTEDWRGEAPEEMLARIRSRVSLGAIVLMHDGVGPGATREGCAATVDLVRPLVVLVRSYGLEPATLGEIRCPLPDRNSDFQA